MKTTVANKESVERKWYVVDAAGQVLGRLASNIAFRLRGKHKPTYTPHVDTGDFIVVVNADKIVLTGKKWKDKRYYRHTGYTGGIKSMTAKDLLHKHPTDLIRFAVKGMLPKNKLGDKLIKKLKIYTGSDHPHTAQRPESLKN